MTFTVTRVLSGGYLVKGTDSNGVEDSVVLKSELWDYVQHRKAVIEADGVFDQTVEDYFRPLLEAAEAHAKATAKPGNEFATVTIGENVEGKKAETFSFDGDDAAIVLNIIEQGKADILVWQKGELIPLG